ncbi:MAG TPA: hypothetical protein VNZ62_00660 [Capillimicrobium sp.]|nr:hypothetical protein [Capillimicrobium sp.]
MPGLRLVVAGTVALLVAGGLSACGGVTRSDEAEPVTVTVTETVQTEESRDRKRAKRRRARAARSARYASCDANISVLRETTTCGFAQNVFYEYWLNDRSAVVEAYSPAVGEVFTTRCREGFVRVTCSTSDGGRVRFPVAAVDAYTEEQAAAYAAGAELGPHHEPEPDSTGGSECDPNYEGACLDPYSYDYDCENGTGDGPDYTGEVYVVGDDHFDLDRDGDGVACDW